MTGLTRERTSEMPASAIVAVAVGVAPLPFLFLYSILFLLRGTILPTSPPDITSTRGGEALSGLVALVFLIAIVLGLYRVLTQRGRGLFLLGQLVCLGVCVDFIVDSSKCDPGVPILLGATSALAVLLVLVRRSWDWVAAGRDDSRALT